MSQLQTLPELSDVVTRSRANNTNRPLETPSDWPAVFSCKLNNHPAIGCIYRSGVVCVVTDSLEHGNVELFTSLYWIEKCPRISGISWEWGITRFLVPQNDGLKKFST